MRHDKRRRSPAAVLTWGRAVEDGIPWKQIFAYLRALERRGPLDEPRRTVRDIQPEVSRVLLDPALQDVFARLAGRRRRDAQRVADAESFLRIWVTELIARAEALAALSAIDVFGVPSFNDDLRDYPGLEPYVALRRKPPTIGALRRWIYQAIVDLFPTIAPVDARVLAATMGAVSTLDPKRSSPKPTTAAERVRGNLRYRPRG